MEQAADFLRDPLVQGVFAAVGALGVVAWIVLFPVRWLHPRFMRLVRKLRSGSSPSELFGQQDNQRGATGNSVQRRTRGEADTLKNLAIAYRKGGHYVEAGRLLVDVLGIHRANNDLAGQANALNNHAIVYRLMGNHETSERTHLEAQELYQKIGDRRGEADNLKNLGIAYREAGLFEAAITAHKRAVEIFEALGDRKSLANALNNLGINYREAGDLAEAHRTFEQARALYQGLGAGGEGPEIVRRALERLDAASPPKPHQKRARKKPPPKPC